MKSIEIRQKFFDFFIKNGHTKVESSSLIPAEDPTLLFANAGMNQFKDCFLGKEQRSYTRAVSIQKCIRAGGKHNDLDNVGMTKRHLTFFEMLGNFSFGDYFKKEAIPFAWDFLTKDLGLPPEKLYVSVYHEDDASYDIWHKDIGIPKERIARLGAADNFWQMGDTGPCGPCTEIYYDKGAQTPEEESMKLGDEGERFLEIWNLVFMQYNRQPDGTDVPLKQTGVDTGMGLERIALVMQNCETVYETDLFENILASISNLSGKSYTSDNEARTAFRVLADHIRSVSLALADGGTPSNEGRGYVIRKIIRRAALFAQKLGSHMIFPGLVDTFIKDMGKIYPELIHNQKLITSIITSEVEKFATNLDRGQVVIDKYLKESAASKLITGKQAFMLYDTYGFPLELTNLIAYEKGYKVDQKGFAKEMELQRLQSGKKDILTDHTIDLRNDLTTEFIGYDKLEITTNITGLISDDQQVDHVKSGSDCWIITQKSPFYVECGGQVSDTAVVQTAQGTVDVIAIKKIGNAIAVQIIAPLDLAMGDTVTLKVHQATRAATIKNHTATHLLQAALVEILGPQIKQAGSLVTPEYLRFDFTHHQNITSEELQQIELIVNQQIMINIPLNIRTTTYKAAIEQGVKAFFGEKYNPENVRVVDIPGFSQELCGGVHVTATGDIGSFKITQSLALSAGVRRIVAVTGLEAVKLFQQDFDMIKQLSQEFKVQHNETLEAVLKQKDELKKTQTALKQTKQELLTTQVPTLLSSVETINGIPFGYIELHDVDGAGLRDFGTLLAGKKPGFYFVVSSNNDTSSFFAICSPVFESQLDLTALSTWLQSKGLKGGGKKGTLQGGGLALANDFKQNLAHYLQK
jgi:alanyl-tRNA synthetase